MNSALFNKLVLSLWGDHWQPPLKALLATHGHDYSRQTFWCWKHNKPAAPKHVILILQAELKRRKQS